MIYTTGNAEKALMKFDAQTTAGGFATTAHQEVRSLLENIHSPDPTFDDVRGVTELSLCGFQHRPDTLELAVWS
jgi:hypothetical protein